MLKAIIIIPIIIAVTKSVFYELTIEEELSQEIKWEENKFLKYNFIQYLQKINN